MAHVVVLVMDANAILDKQDLTIARLVVDEGRALVIAINKWDPSKPRRGRWDACRIAWKRRCRRCAASLR